MKSSTTQHMAPAVEAARPGRLRRLVSGRAFRQNVLLLVLMILFGFILMNHVMSVRAEHSGNSLAERYKQRQLDLEAYEKQYDDLLAENAALNQQKLDAEQSLLASQGLDNLQAELAKYRILAGFTEVSGPGVIVTLDDKPDYTLSDTDGSIVHDSDIRHALDLLSNAGAAAFSINGNRYTNSSNIKCIGSTIRCNLERLSPPYIIIALGDPVLLAEAITTDQLFLYRQTSGIDLVVKVETSDQVVIPAFADADNIGQFIDRLEVVTP